MYNLLPFRDKLFQETYYSLYQSSHIFIKDLFIITKTNRAFAVCTSSEQHYVQVGTTVQIGGVALSGGIVRSLNSF